MNHFISIHRGQKVSLDERPIIAVRLKKAVRKKAIRGRSQGPVQGPFFKRAIIEGHGQSPVLGSLQKVTSCFSAASGSGFLVLTTTTRSVKNAMSDGFFVQSVFLTPDKGQREALLSLLHCRYCHCIFDIVPRILVYPRNALIQTGQNIKLTCASEDASNTKLQWVRTAVNASTPSDRAVLVRNYTTDGIKSVLVIRNAKTADSGVYECLLTHPTINKLERVKLEVKGKRRGKSL